MTMGGPNILCAHEYWNATDMPSHLPVVELP